LGRQRGKIQMERSRRTQNWEGTIEGKTKEESKKETEG
jgi:hypothetical protein